MKSRCTFLLLLLAAYFLFSTGCAAAHAASAGEGQAIQDTGRAKINEPDQDGRTPLIHAVWNGKTEVAQALLDVGADVNIADAKGSTPLIYAVGYKYPIIAEMLIKRGADVNARTKDNETSLHIAASNCDDKMAKLLIDNNAAVNIQDSNGSTPLHNTARYCFNKQIIDYLFSKNPDANLKDKLGWSALQYAIYYGNVEGAVAIRKKTNFTEDLSFLTSDKGLKNLYHHVKETEMYSISEDRKKVFQTAVSDCKYFAVTTKGGGRVSNASFTSNVSRLDILKLSITKKFVSCMDQMGFSCTKNCPK